MSPPKTVISRVALPDLDGHPRWLMTRSAYEKRHEDPKQDYGISGVDLVFALGTPERDRAVDWRLMTGHHLPETEKRLLGQHGGPTAGGVTFHYPEPQAPSYLDELPSSECWLLGAEDETVMCNSDIGFTLGDEVYEAWAKKGLDGVYEALMVLLKGMG